jgi:hypothetical protein
MSGQWIDPESRIAARLVLAWVRTYTRRVPSAAAEQRRAELASDVWEQVNDTELMGLAAGPFLLWRAARSVPSDLAWRRAARTGDHGARPPVHIRWERSGLLGVMTLEGVAAAVVMLGTFLHVIHGGGAGSLGSSTASVLAALAGGALLAVVGLLLLVRRRTRWLAPAILGVATTVLLLTALPVLVRISTSVAAFWYTSPLSWTHPGWAEIGIAGVVLSAILHLAVLLAWLPGRPAPVRGTAR